MSDKAIITCALTGVLTDPTVHNVPVTPEQMADDAEQAWNEGAVIVHCHFRDQRKGMGHLPTWDVEVVGSIIAAIKGHCYGAGFGMTLASDIRVAGESAIFCNAFVKIGVSGADCGSSYWLPRILGFSRAAEMMYTGRDVPASEAAQIGLVSKVVPDAEVLDAALVIARNILNCSPLGIRCTKEALNANVNAPSLETAIQFENRTQVLCLTTKDANEGVLSFIEKRKPKYGEW